MNISNEDARQALYNRMRDAIENVDYSKWSIHHSLRDSDPALYEQALADTYERDHNL